MEKYEFKLNPAFSLYSGVTVGWQKGSSVVFVTERMLKMEVKTSLKRSFINYVRFVRGRDACPERFYGDVKVLFLYAPRMKLRRHLFRLLRGSKNEEVIA